jgi:hypothetical protein
MIGMMYWILNLYQCDKDKVLCRLSIVVWYWKIVTAATVLAFSLNLLKWHHRCTTVGGLDDSDGCNWICDTKRCYKRYGYFYYYKYNNGRYSYM